MKNLIALLLVFAVAACATPLRNQLELASQANRAYTERTTLLLQNDLITTQEAASRLAQIKQARDAIRLASVALTQCEATKDTKCDAAASRLHLAQSLGQQIELELLKREKEKRQ
jgi:hypothetical protein